MSAAELSIGLRLPGGTRADVRQALWTDRSVVKTYGPRGTVHLLAAAELPMWTAALSAIPAPAHDPLLTAEQTDVIVDAIGVALGGGDRTVDELGELVIAAAGSWVGDLVLPAFGGMWPRWRHAIRAAAYRGVLCFGPQRGRHITYTHPKRWLSGLGVARSDSATALTDLVARYLRAYGPATSAQFARWLGAPKPWAAALFESMAGQLERVWLGESAAWVPAGDGLVAAGGASGAGEAGVLLLPYFDAYVVGSHPRDRLFPGPVGARGLAHGQAGTFPTLLIGGTVAGVWHCRRSGGTIEITVDPVAALTAGHSAELAAQADRIGHILQAKARLTVGELTIGPHA